MMDREQTVREMVARETAPLIADCERMRAEIDRAEQALPIVLDKHERDAARRDRDQLRARLQSLLSDLRGVEDRILRLADERWPSWR
jgi:predicted  nucleic acid-binding Zn-ribbon protein